VTTEEGISGFNGEIGIVLLKERLFKNRSGLGTGFKDLETGGAKKQSRRKTKIPPNANQLENAYGIVAPRTFKQ
jgi:hypothetical protein